MKRHVWSKERGVRLLKAEANFEAYREKYPSARLVKVPSVRKLEEWSNECGCKAIDGCWVEPDGTCGHGFPSWLLAMGMI